MVLVRYKRKLTPVSLNGWARLSRSPPWDPARPRFRPLKEQHRQSVFTHVHSCRLALEPVWHDPTKWFCKNVHEIFNAPLTSTTLSFRLFSSYSPRRSGRRRDTHHYPSPHRPAPETRGVLPTGPAPRPVFCTGTRGHVEYDTGPLPYSQYSQYLIIPCQVIWPS